MKSLLDVVYTEKKGIYIDCRVVKLAQAAGSSPVSWLPSSCLWLNRNKWLVQYKSNTKQYRTYRISRLERRDQAPGSSPLNWFCPMYLYTIVDLGSCINKGVLSYKYFRAVREDQLSGRCPSNWLLPKSLCIDCFVIKIKTRKRKSVQCY